MRPPPATARTPTASRARSPGPLRTEDRSEATGAAAVADVPSGRSIGAGAGSDAVTPSLGAAGAALARTAVSIADVVAPEEPEDVAAELPADDEERGVDVLGGADEGVVDTALGVSFFFGFVVFVSLAGVFFSSEVEPLLAEPLVLPSPPAVVPDPVPVPPPEPVAVPPPEPLSATGVDPESPVSA
jgi:hypothetical protein